MTEFITPALRASGFIFTSIDALEATLEDYLMHHDALAEKRAAARDSIMALHDNAALSRRYVEVYDRARASHSPASVTAGAGA